MQGVPQGGRHAGLKQQSCFPLRLDGVYRKSVNNPKQGRVHGGKCKVCCKWDAMQAQNGCAVLSYG